MRRLAIAVALLGLAGAAAAQMADPAECLTFRRVTASGGSQILNSTTCAGIYFWPSGRDSTGAKKAATWSGGPYSQWCAEADSTDTYDFCFKNNSGTDSVIVGSGERRVLFGPNIAPPRGSVAASSLLLDEQGRFAPESSFIFGGLDSVFVRWMFADSEDVSIHVMDELELRAGVAIDTSQVLTIRGKNPLASYVVLREVNDRITATVESLKVNITDADTLDCDSLHARAGLIDESLTVDGQLYSNGDVWAYDDVLATDDVIATDDVTASGGVVTAGTSDQAGELHMYDGSSHIYKFTPPSSSVDWDMPIPIYADTLLLSTARYKAGDRLTSKYVPGLIATDICAFTFHAGTTDGSPGATWAFGMVAVADSFQFGWGSSLDNKIVDVVIFRK